MHLYAVIKPFFQILNRAQIKITNILHFFLNIAKMKISKQTASYTSTFPELQGESGIGFFFFFVIEYVPTLLMFVQLKKE